MISFPIGRRVQLPARRQARQAGLTILEIVLVITIIAFIYGVALPQFGLQTGAEVATKMAQLAGDFRNAYDLSVLSGKTHRVVLDFNSGDYWLEVADRPIAFLGSERLGRDPTPEEEKEALENFDVDFEEYEDLVGDIVVDEENEEEIPPTSPLVSAKERLRPVQWTRVTDLEWQGRTIGPYLMIPQMQAEHHGQMQELTDLGEGAHAFIYVFPTGYIERAVIYVAYKEGDMVFDGNEDEWYTLTTRPYDGTAVVESGKIPFDVSSDDDNA